MVSIETSNLFFFNDTATTEIYTLSLHDALPISLPEPAFTLSLKVRTRLDATATLVELSAGLVPDKVGGVVSAGGGAITSSLATAEKHTSVLPARTRTTRHAIVA